MSLLARIKPRLSAANPTLIFRRLIRNSRKPKRSLAQQLDAARSNIAQESGVESSWLLAPNHKLTVVNLLLKPLMFSGIVASGAITAGYLGNVYLQKHYPAMRRQWQRTAMDTVRSNFPASISQYLIQWILLPPHSQFAHAFVGLNVLVFGAWMLPPLRRFMHFNFLHAPMSGRLTSMIGSSLSHKQLWHLAFNSIAFVSFVPLVYYNLGGVLPTAGFCLASGVVASSASLLYSYAVRSLVPGLGASGIVFALFGFTTCLAPDTKLSIIFLPFFTFTAEQALIGVMLFDAAGMIFRFSSLGHAAHMGGTIFGYVYANYSQDIGRTLTRFWYRLLQ
eukprot:TRINITY_DN10270_c0_g1_i7.p1 TRINITY_DN10270_c0_g1~~TRINITY_DN10270_c0_g1_i7.p1  ORF type:complete len:335 (+),score=48.34 TRINITY_DN10270_c0_g1_i7:297-1301(+)